jgi:hypothetical protein
MCGYECVRLRVCACDCACVSCVHFRECVSACAFVCVCVFTDAWCVRPCLRLWVCDPVHDSACVCGRACMCACVCTLVCVIECVSALVGL